MICRINKTRKLHRQIEVEKKINNKKKDGKQNMMLLGW